jgi:hypothetical protein
MGKSSRKKTVQSLEEDAEVILLTAVLYFTK